MYGSSSDQLRGCRTAGSRAARLISSFLFLTFLVAGMLPKTARAQWITGFWSAQNTKESIANIPWSNITHLTYFAAGISSSGTVVPAYTTQPELSNLVSAAHANGVKILIVLSDGTGNYFEPAAGPSLVSTTAANIASYVNTNNFDGVDFDWEANVNITDYEALISHTRSALGSGKLITTDVYNAGGNLEPVMANQYANLDQINAMCYDMDWGSSFTWHNDALLQNGDTSKMTCDWRTRAFTNAGVPAAKIGVGTPFYGRHWTGTSSPLQTGGTQANPRPDYRDLVSGGLINSTNLRWDSTYSADYLSLPGTNEFYSFNGTRFIDTMVPWAKSKGYGGYMIFTLEYEYISSASGSAHYPLSTELHNQVFGGASSPDTTPPSVPAGLSATAASSSQINLAWSASTDNVGVTGYNVYKNTVKIATTASPSYSATGLSSSTNYSFAVSAYDAAGNTSLLSNTVSATTQASTDTTPPSVPAGLSAAAVSSSQINLSWSASTDNVGVTGYKVYKNGTQIATATGTSYSDTGLNPSTTYSYSVSAYDAAGNTSPQSGTVSAATQAASSGGPAGYAFCANEGGTCAFSGTMSVAYGANSLFKYLTLTGGTPCNNTVFGDPIPGTVKACYTKAVTAPAVSISPASLTFASQAVGTTSAVQYATITNTGSATLTFPATFTFTGSDFGFGGTGTCAASIGPGASCTVGVTFKPTATGTRTGAVNIGDNAANSPQTIPLSGTGGTVSAPAVSISPASLTFASQAVGTTSAVQYATITNTGSATLTFPATFTFTGSDFGFGGTGTCAASIGPGASCTVGVTFKPTATGTRTGAVNISDNAANSPQTIPLSGTGSRHHP
jgi:chitodextrinase